MQSSRPHVLARKRIVFLLLALLSLAVTAVTLVGMKSNPRLPLREVIALSGVVFVWSNGLYWWLELCYPHIEVAAGQYASRVERGSGGTAGKVRAFFVMYGAVALLVTLACFNLGFSS